MNNNFRKKVVDITKTKCYDIKVVTTTTTWTLKTEQATLMKQSFLNEAKHRYQLFVDTLAKQMSFQTTFMESLILAQDERWRRA